MDSDTFFILSSVFQNAVHECCILLMDGKCRFEKHQRTERKKGNQRCVWQGEAAIKSYFKRIQDILGLDSSRNHINLLLICIDEDPTFCFGVCSKQSTASQPNSALCLFFVGL